MQVAGSKLSHLHSCAAKCADGQGGDDVPPHLPAVVEVDARSPRHPKAKTWHTENPRLRAESMSSPERGNMCKICRKSPLTTARRSMARDGPSVCRLFPAYRL